MNNMHALLKTILSIWDNKVIKFQTIEVSYYDNDNQANIQCFEQGYEYPSQTWRAHKIIIYDQNNNLLTYEDVYITYEYGKDFILE